jgi:hypothetical protein
MKVVQKRRANGNRVSETPNAGQRNAAKKNITKSWPHSTDARNKPTKKPTTFN